MWYYNPGKSIITKKNKNTTVYSKKIEEGGEQSGENRRKQCGTIPKNYSSSKDYRVIDLLFAQRVQRWVNTAFVKWNNLLHQYSTTSGAAGRWSRWGRGYVPGAGKRGGCMMDRILTKTADEYLSSKKLIRTMGAVCVNKAEVDAVENAVEALTFAVARMDNPPLRRAQLEDRHGQPVFCTTPWGATAGGLVDVNREIVWILGQDGVISSPWFYGGCTGKYYAWPQNSADLRLYVDDLKALRDSVFNR